MFRRLDGNSIGTEVRYPNFGPDQPKSKDHNCAYYDPRGFWGTDECNSTKPFICERPANVCGVIDTCRTGEKCIQTDANINGFECKMVDTRTET